ncbi:dCTP deaminase [Methanofollis aquaemaris]|uniref:dCTP deaminase n=1 Tax=Methanofollis aquaemaris TaxID=126734 RepID=A0A8A3S696_9EURY|nr:dCTP deaminase [Methanofollis aquaemaris]QSZ67154.1 dCTP deaminase [Methanofollis aquaemaris]
MILSSAEIQSRLMMPGGAGRLVITPFNDASLQPASYDLRAGEEIVLAPGTVTLVPSMEHVEIPGDVAATLRCRSSYARRGLLLGGGFVDPGFRGQLTLCLVNMGAEEVVLPEGERVVQMILHEVGDGAACYNGRYQDSEGVVEAR